MIKRVFALFAVLLLASSLNIGCEEQTTDVGSAIEDTAEEVNNY